MTVEPYLEFRAVTDSTNDDVREAFRLGCAHGAAIYAGEQRKGRGRLGRTWHGPERGNLYLSVALTQDTARADLRVLPFLAAVSVAQWLRDESSVEFGLKWPNDVLVGDCKLAGILCEGVAGPRGGMAAVIGIGMNVNAEREDYPDELRSKVTSLKMLTGRTYDVRDVASAIRVRVVRWYDTLLLAGSAPILDQWRTFEATSGRRVRIVEDDVIGRADGIENDGALRVHLPDGTTRRVYAGDVEFVDLRS